MSDTLSLSLPGSGRIFTPAHQRNLKMAASFTGLPASFRRFEIIKALKICGHEFGFTRRFIAHLELLVAYTNDADWHRGNPIAWPSVSHTAERLGISREQVRRNELRLVELSAIVHRDSGNHRRYGQRNESQGGNEPEKVAQAPPNRGTPIDIYKENYQSPPAGDGEILHGLRQEKEQSSDVFAAKLCRDAHDALGTDKADSLMNLIEEKVRVGRVRFPGGYLRALLDRHHAGHSRLPMMTPSARSTWLRPIRSLCPASGSIASSVSLMATPFVLASIAGHP